MERFAMPPEVGVCAPIRGVVAITPPYRKLPQGDGHSRAALYLGSDLR